MNYQILHLDTFKGEVWPGKKDGQRHCWLTLWNWKRRSSQHCWSFLTTLSATSLPKVAREKKPFSDFSKANLALCILISLCIFVTSFSGQHHQHDYYLSTFLILASCPLCFVDPQCSDPCPCVHGSSVAGSWNAGENLSGSSSQLKLPASASTVG